MFGCFSLNLLRSVRRGSWSEGTKGVNDNRSFCVEELAQTPSSFFTISMVRKPFQSLISFPPGGFKALFFSGGWKNSCVPSTTQAFVLIPSLLTLLPV